MGSNGPQANNEHALFSLDWMIFLNYSYFILKQLICCLRPQRLKLLVWKFVFYDIKWKPN